MENHFSRWLILNAVWDTSPWLQYGQGWEVIPEQNKETTALSCAQPSCSPGITPTDERIKKQPICIKIPPSSGRRCRRDSDRLLAQEDVCGSSAAYSFWSNTESSTCSTCVSCTSPMVKRAAERDAPHILSLYKYLLRVPARCQGFLQYGNRTAERRRCSILTRLNLQSKQWIINKMSYWLIDLLRTSKRLPVLYPHTHTHTLFQFEPQ